MKIGQTIKRLRKEHNMTLAQLSETSGVALATLSRMENGKMTGTLDSHAGIAGAFGMELPELYKDMCGAKKRVDVRNREARAEVTPHDSRSSEEMLASKVSGKKMMPLLVKIAKGGRTRKDASGALSEKFIYVLEGKVEANIGQERYDLCKNDSLYFVSNTPHYFRNTGSSDARLVSVECPPAS